MKAPRTVRGHARREFEATQMSLGARNSMSISEDAPASRGGFVGHAEAARLDVIRAAVGHPPGWGRRLCAYAAALGWVGVGRDEAIAAIEDASPWPDARKYTPGVMRAYRIIWETAQGVFLSASKERCAGAVRGMFSDHDPADPIRHIDGACNAGAAAADVDADTLAAVVLAELAGKGLRLDQFTAQCLDDEARMAWRHPWFRPSLQPDEPPPPNPAAYLAALTFAEWRA